MFSIMLAAEPRREEASTPFPAPVNVEDRPNKPAEGRALESSSTRRAEGRWSEAVTAENRVLPHTARTCILWCAIGLGALVRGCPLIDVGMRHCLPTLLLHTSP